MKIFISIVCVLIAIILAYVGVSFFGVDKELAVSLVTVILAALKLQQSYLEDREREREARLHSEKSKIYANIFDLINDMFGQGKTGKTVKNDRMLRELINIRRDLLAWGNQDTVKAFNNLTEVTQKMADGEQYQIERLRKCGEAVGILLLAMRKDLGQRDTVLKPLELFFMFMDEDAKKQLREGS